MAMNSSPAKFISIFNDVLGPVMRGQSSSHTAGSYFIGKMARELLGEPPSAAKFIFHPDGSYSRVFQAQGSDLAFAAALLDWTLTDERFPQALKVAHEKNIQLEFSVSPFPEADHPNSVKILLKSKKGKSLSLVAKSIGGGAIKIVKLNNWPVGLDGKNHVVIIPGQKADSRKIQAIIQAYPGEIDLKEREGQALLVTKFQQKPDQALVRELRSLSLGNQLWMAPPLVFPQKGEPIFSSGEEIILQATKRNLSLGKIALTYEASLLGLSEEECYQEMKKRWQVMKEAITAGFEEDKVHLTLLEPSAPKIKQAIDSQAVAIGGPHARAAARAMAVMHTANSLGRVCAAPTGGSAGVIPGVVATLAEEKNLDETQIVLALFAAGAVGLIVAHRATFAAEIAGCQVEIGAAGAMGAAAVVEAAGGNCGQALDAAAISLQNTMGSPCDLVQERCEIPCHTRNAVAAASAFVCADIVLGGYQNPIPLDETIDAVLASGQMLPPELRCTSLGGLAVTPSALKLKKKK